MAPDPKEELFEYAYSKTVCQQRPEICKPREIRMVLFDADDTMWHIDPGQIASNITGTLTLVDPDTIEVGPESPGAKKETRTTGYTKPKKEKRKHLITEEEYGSWWKSPPPRTSKEPPPAEDEELESIQHELTHSLTDKQYRLLEEAQEKAPEPVQPPAKSEKPVYLDDVRGLKVKQVIAVEHLIKQYGQKQCRITDVHDDGDLTITCGKEKWVMTTNGMLFEEKPLVKPPAEVTYLPAPVTYKPRKQTITLLPTFRETLQKLNDRKIPVTVISLNAPGTVKRIVDAFGLGDKILEVHDTWENKGEVFAEITKAHKIAPWEALFIDNTASHVDDVSRKCGFGLVIGKGKDVEKPLDIMKFIKA